MHQFLTARAFASAHCRRDRQPAAYKLRFISSALISARAKRESAMIAKLARWPSATVLFAWAARV